MDAWQVTVSQGRGASQPSPPFRAHQAQQDETKSDIDRLFSAMLSYSVLAILGLALVLGVMPTASQAASDAFGLAPAHGQILFAFGLAAIVVPAHGSLSSLQAD